MRSAPSSAAAMSFTRSTIQEATRKSAAMRYWGGRLGPIRALEKLCRQLHGRIRPRRPDSPRPRRSAGCYRPALVAARPRYPRTRAVLARLALARIGVGGAVIVVMAHPGLGVWEVGLITSFGGEVEVVISSVHHVEA